MDEGTRWDREELPFINMCSLKVLFLLLSQLRKY